MEKYSLYIFQSSSLEVEPGVKVQTVTLPVLDLLLVLSSNEEFDSVQIAKETYVECKTIWHKNLKRILALQ
jgi:hypothetical protein